MTKIRTALTGAIAAATLFTATATPLSQASANPRENWMHMNNGHNGDAAAAGMAIGLGIAILGSAIAAHNRAAAPGAVKQNKQNCRFRDEWKKLLKEAERALQRDWKLHLKYPKQHSFQHVSFAKDEVRRRRARYEHFRRLCK